MCKKINQFLSVILARKNSKRIKNKNLKKVNGKSLIENTILFAKKYEKISTILISSDSDKIYKIAKKFKSIIFYTRKKNFLEPKVSPLYC